MSHHVAWLKCATFDACKITASDGGAGMWISTAVRLKFWEAILTH
jgi:hypothetical protein